MKYKINIYLINKKFHPKFEENQKDFKMTLRKLHNNIALLK